MNVAPVHRLKKTEIVWLANHTCRAHRHAYLQHYTCFLREQPNSRRIGFLDIEASNLKADFGIILSWCIKPLGEKKILEDVLKANDITKATLGTEDTRIVRNLVKAMEQFDELVTYYGTGFDIPFIRTRAVMDEISFPHFGSIKHTDLYYVVRGRFKLSSNRLENANRQLLGKTEKTRIDSKYWRAGVRGHAESLAYILDHNRHDVTDLEKLYVAVLPFMKRTERSI